MEVDEGRFRDDLYFRLNVVPIIAPPLRDRTGDIPLLVEAFVKQLAERNGLPQKALDPKVYDLLASYAWPGNVRELRNLVERMLILSAERILPSDLPAEIRQSSRTQQMPNPVAASDHNSARSFAQSCHEAYRGTPLRELRDIVERDFIHATLSECDWNVTRAAEMLGIERTNLHKKMRHHGIERS